MKQNVPAGAIKKAICYLYLLAYCPPGKLAEFQETTREMHRKIAEEAGLKETELPKKVWPQACFHIVAFHQATREPDGELVNALTKAAQGAEKNAKTLRAFKDNMRQVVTLPGRARAENRLHRNKGCKFCLTPCRYGYFSLVSDPDLKQLQEFFDAEAKRPAGEQTPLRPAYGFAISHLTRVTGADRGVIAFPHVVNLAFCLLLLGMAKSRMALPETELYIFQEGSRKFMQRVLEQK